MSYMTRGIFSFEIPSSERYPFGNFALICRSWLLFEVFSSRVRIRIVIWSTTFDRSRLSTGAKSATPISQNRQQPPMHLLWRLSAVMQLHAMSPSSWWRWRWWLQQSPLFPLCLCELTASRRNNSLLIIIYTLWIIIIDQLILSTFYINLLALDLFLTLDVRVARKWVKLKRDRLTM